MSHSPLGLAVRQRDYSESTPSRKPLVYLACPYTSPLPITRLVRNALATEAAAILMEQGYAVFSPISHGHAIMGFTDCLGMDAATWASVNDPVLSICDAVAVLDVEGMWQSTGVRAEVALAAERRIPVNMVKVVGGTFFLTMYNADPMLWSNSEGKL